MLQNLVILLNIPSSLNLAVIGAVILVGVAADQLLGQRRRSPCVTQDFAEQKS